MLASSSLRGEAARRPLPQLAPRRPHRGAHRRERDPGGPPPEDRGVRHPALRASPLPRGLREFAPWRCGWDVAGILYGAILAFSQTDLKRLVAYTSVSHLGFVLVGAFAGSRLALQGVVMQMICHGSAPGPLHPGGGLQERIHTRDMRLMGGLWEAAPRMGRWGSSSPSPRWGSRAGELHRRDPDPPGDLRHERRRDGGGLAGTGGLHHLRAVALRHGVLRAREADLEPADLSARDLAIFAALILAIVWLGLYPQPVLDTAKPALEGLLKAASG